MSENGGSFTLERRGLKQLIKAFKTDIPYGRIGIMAGGGQREEPGAPSNAFIGACHEFGTSKLPRRSFLRDPIATNLEKNLEKARAFKKETMEKVMKDGSLKPFMKLIMVTAEATVARAFDTGNDGKWKPSDMTLKENWQTLVETQQLRNSITSDVK